MNLYTIENIYDDFLITDIVCINNKLYCIISDKASCIISSSEDMYKDFKLLYFDIENQTFSDEIQFEINGYKLYPYSLTCNNNILYIGTIRSNYLIVWNMINSDMQFYDTSLDSPYNNNYVMKQLLITNNKSIYIILYEYKEISNATCHCCTDEKKNRCRRRKKEKHSTAYA